MFSSKYNKIGNIFEQTKKDCSSNHNYIYEYKQREAIFLAFIHVQFNKKMN